MSLRHLLHVNTGRDGVDRRAFLKTVTVGSLAAGGAALGWRDTLALHADDLRRREMSCILLFMRGGPSQFETLDPKPGHANGGPTQAIDTKVQGIRLAEGWTKLADEMESVALIRSMRNREGEHQRAEYQMHTGYIPAGGVRFPTLGSIVSSEIAPKDFDLPHFVTVGGRGGIGSGFLGQAYAPFVVNDPNQLPSNATLPGGVNSDRLDRRLSLRNDLERDFAENGGAHQAGDQKQLVANAAAMVRSPRLRAFDLSSETNATRDRYGRTAFGQGCLLARRLVEVGVTFVEVELPGWDTHQNNFDSCKRLSAQADAGFGSLVKDLRERGRLDRTLILWMGEFGRTPRINGNTGRDHYPRAFSIALAGGGVKGGQVIGSTNDGGTDIANRPVGVADLFCSVFRAMGINGRKENMSPQGRPIKLVDGGEAVRELFA